MSCGERAGYAVMANCGERHRCDAAALLAVGIASELAWRDAGFEIGGKCLCGAREDAIFRTAGWCGHFVQQFVWHLDEGILLAQSAEICDD